jgi:hypothetical protein
MKMVDLCKESFSHSFGANYSPEVVGDATFICLNVAFWSMFSGEKEKEQWLNDASLSLFIKL